MSKNISGKNNLPEGAAEKIPLLIEEFDRLYPNAECSLRYEDPLQLLISTRLSAQCTDARVNMVTPALFARYPDCRTFAEADISELEGYIRSTGFYHAKAKNIKECCAALLEKYDGKVPSSMEELVALPGVGRKTANLVLGDAFGQPSYVVDTHAIRLCGRIGLSDNTEPVKIECDLRELLPPEASGRFCHQLVLHGRAVCGARRPMCGDCSIAALCRFTQGKS